MSPSKPLMCCACAIAASTLTSRPVSLLLVPPEEAVARLHPLCGSLHAGDTVLLLIPPRNKLSGNYSYSECQNPFHGSEVPSTCANTAQSAKGATQKEEPPKTLPMLPPRPRDLVKEKFTSSRRGLSEDFLNTKTLA